MKFITDKRGITSPVLKQGPNGYTETCPFCFRSHIHGYGSGHRSPHCASPIVKQIILSDGRNVFQNDGYFLKHLKTNQQ